MIAIFDSGHGGLTVLRTLAARFPDQPFLYFGDHANVPYGNRPSAEVIDLTRRGVVTLFERGAKLVLLCCNTATAVAARELQQHWLPTSGWQGRNVLGIVAPTVEAATQTAWAVTAPQYPQKYNTDTIAVFGTTRTVASGVYREEITKRCPRARVIEQVCPGLVAAIEAGALRDELDGHVRAAVDAMLAQAGASTEAGISAGARADAGEAGALAAPQVAKEVASEAAREATLGNARYALMPPHRAILGCTHFPLVEDLFRAHLPSFTRLLPQPDIVADSLEDYLQRHPAYARPHDATGIANEPAGKRVHLLTSGSVDHVNATARLFWPEAPQFERL
ncbi:MAG: glutamate racemase [Pseudomonadota bacterium]